MIEINLLPDVKRELIQAQRIRSMVTSIAIIIGIASVSVVAVLAMYIFTVQAVRGAIDDNNIKEGSKKLAAVTDLSKTLTIQNQLTKISTLNSDKKIDSRIFDVLTVIIPPAPNDVKISDLTIDHSASLITINGQASNSYAAVEVFKKTISGAEVLFTDSDNKQQQVTLASNISTSNTSYGEDNAGVKVLRFTISFNYAPELFAPSSKNTTVKIDSNGNVTDSYLGVPTSIFADRAKDLMEGN